MRGKSWKFGDNIDTDVIIPARYLNTFDGKELAKHCMEDIDPEFVKKINPGDMIVAGNNFGCGSSREHAPLAIKSADISCVIAKSFARIFYRNSLNIGLPILECPDAIDDIKQNDSLEIDLSSGTITNLSSGKTYQAIPYPDFMLSVIKAGGLINQVKQNLSRN